MSVFSHVEISAAHKTTVSSQQLLNEQDYTAVTPPRPHRWTQEQKLTIFLLRQRYHLSWSTIRLLFKALFQHEFSSLSGPTTAAFASRFYQLLKDGFNFSGSWLSLRQAIESKARELAITLRCDTSDRDCHEGASERFPNSDLDHDSDTDGTLLEDDLDMKTPSRSTNRPRNEKLVIPLCTSISTQSKQKQRTANKKIPRLAFRA